MSVAMPVGLLLGFVAILGLLACGTQPIARPVRVPVRQPGTRPASATVWRRTLGAAGASLLLLGAAAAQATEATDLAQRAGLVLGHAYRCSVPGARLKASAAMVDGLISAYSVSGDDELAARSDFIKRTVVSARATPLADPLPSCAVVREQLSRLDQQHRTREPHSTAQ